MEPLEQEEDIMEEENIRIEYIRKNSNDIGTENPYQYATVADIRTFERGADTHNQKLIDQRPNLLGEDEFMSSSSVHFVN